VKRADGWGRLEEPTRSLTRATLPFRGGIRSRRAKSPRILYGPGRPSSLFLSLGLYLRISGTRHAKPRGMERQAAHRVFPSCRISFEGCGRLSELHWRFRASGCRQRHRPGFRASWDEATCQSSPAKLLRRGVIMPRTDSGPPGAGLRAPPQAPRLTPSTATSREDALDE